MEEKDRPCVIHSRDGYSTGVASYMSDLYNAKIYKFGEVPDYMKGDNHKIIFLDSKEGLELIAEERERIDPQIDNLNQRLRSLEKGRAKLYEVNPLIDEYIKSVNRFTLVPASKEEKQNIINRIYEKQRQ